MKNLLILLLFVITLLACAAGSILLARGWFTLRTSGAPAAQSVPPAPTVVAVPALPSPTAAAPAVLPPVAGPGSDSPAAAGFNGTFSGTLFGDDGSVVAVLSGTDARPEVSRRNVAALRKLLAEM